MKKNPNILFCTHTSPAYMPAADLSSRQIVVGPNMENKRSALGRVMSVKTDTEFDVAALISRLPPDQKPDLVVSLIDSFLLCQPRNLANVTCRKVLYLADTHHGQRPLTRNFAYAETERYDRIAMAHTPHHLHWFVEAGFAPVALHLNLGARDHVRANFSAPRKPTVAFVGQLGTLHVFRRKMVAHLKDNDVNIDVRSMPASEAARFYGSSQLVLNTSNGDLNMRFFEVLSSGGCLLTDRLSDATGYGHHFVEDEHFIAYGDEAELLDKARFYLSRPDLCLAMARRGHEVYRKRFSEAERKRRFLEYAFADDETAKQLAVADHAVDPRVGTASPQAHEHLAPRAMIYEQVQELQARDMVRQLVLSPGVPTFHDRDLGDLMRMRLTRNAPQSGHFMQVLVPDELEAFLASEVAARCHFIHVLPGSPVRAERRKLLNAAGFDTVNSLNTNYPGFYCRMPLALG
jgi:hypothetical protein